jgi:hypothetical protein
MKDKPSEILYSEPVKEIISNPPRKIIRWGTALIFSIFLFLILLSWLIKYPDIVSAPIEITTVNPPITLVSKITGRINKLYVKDGEKVIPGQLLAVMETAASIQEYKLLTAAIGNIKDPEKLFSDSLLHFSELGELQPYYATFLKALSDFNTFIRNDYYGNKINSLTIEITSLKEYIDRMKVKENLVSDNLVLERKKFKRDSILFSGKVFPESDLEKSKQAYNLIRLELQQAGLDRSARVIEATEKNQQILDYRIRGEEEKQKLISILNESFLNLNAQIKIWENKYLLISPVKGIVTFTKYWSENQSPLIDQPVLNVVPENAGNYIGRINLSMVRSGKVKINQVVNIKLSSFPYLEYGMVRGIVNTKSLVPSGDAYIIEVSLPQGLKTLYGKELDFTQNMRGTAEIITEDIRLLQKIINPLRHLISKNKS